LMELSLEFLARELGPTDTRRGLERSDTLKFVPGLLQHIKHHRNILENNRGTAAASIIMQNMRKTVDGLVVRELEESALLSSISDSTIVFMCGGLMAIIEQWNEHDCRVSVGDTVKKIDTQIGNILKQYR